MALAKVQCEFATGAGELYGVNMRHLRSLILRARERPDDPAAARLRVRVRAPFSDAVVEATLRTGDLYLVSVANRGAEFFFQDHTGPRLIADQVLLGFTGHYNDLGSYALLALTAASIDHAIAGVACWRRSDAITNRRKDRFGRQQITPEAGQLMILILMLCEAARFYAIEETVANALDGRPGAPLGMEEIEALVHEWGARSAAGDFRTVAVRSPGA